MACCARDCSSNRGKGYLMFSFPVDPCRRAVWIRTCGMEKDWSARNKKLCELHFAEDQWLRFKVRLKPSAVPTLFSKHSPALENLYQTNVKKKCPRQSILCTEKTEEPPSSFQDVWRVSNNCDVCGFKCCAQDVKPRKLNKCDISKHSEIRSLREHNDALKSHIAFLSKQLLDAKVSMFDHHSFE